MDINQTLQLIWKSDSFINGERYFWLYNYEFFRIIDEEEFRHINRTPYTDGLIIFAIADNNGDKEPYACLMYDKDGNILIERFFAERKKGPREIAKSLTELFETDHIAQLLISQKDEAFWYWNSCSFYESMFSVDVPKGVLPRFDLRHYFKNELKGTFVSFHQEFNNREFISYFAQFGVDSFIPEDFYVFRTTDKKLLDLIDAINANLGSEVFFLVDFNPSAYWGIGNYKIINNEQRQLIIKYGLLSNSREIVYSQDEY